ncbi:WXG100 family type VII secretion target [Yinghuangia seranimata]|uniref:WXG100 family type VII secretion target n=1 Tax=Yinghuangia seranimata TaxID=408067 RepID=UPI00248AAC2D|nr:hypothetical protein [Yinghuangia seranimata]MDI2132472.1 hypothetical protein [Yinghuangia seranimata]
MIPSDGGGWSGTDFSQYTHEQLLEMFSSNSASAVTDAATKLASISRRMTQAAEELSKHAANLDWEGASADQFQQWTTGLVNNTHTVASGVMTVSTAVNDIGTQIAQTKLPPLDHADQSYVKDMTSPTMLKARSMDRATDPVASAQLDQDVNAAKTRLEAAHNEAVNAMQKLGSTYQAQTSTIDGVRLPDYGPPPNPYGVRLEDQSQFVASDGGNGTGGSVRKSTGGTGGSVKGGSQGSVVGSAPPSRTDVTPGGPGGHGGTVNRGAPVTGGPVTPYQPAPPSDTSLAGSGQLSGGGTVTDPRPGWQNPGTNPPGGGTVGPGNNYGPGGGLLTPGGGYQPGGGVVGGSSGGGSVRGGGSTGGFGGGRVGGGGSVAGSELGARPGTGGNRFTTGTGQGGGVVGGTPTERGGSTGGTSGGRGGMHGGGGGGGVGGGGGGGGRVGGNRLATGSSGGMVGGSGGVGGSGRSFSSGGSGLRSGLGGSSAPRTGPGGAPEGGGRSGSSMRGGMGGGSGSSEAQRRRRQRADYLEEDEETWEGHGRDIVPPVIG